MKHFFPQLFSTIWLSFVCSLASAETCQQDQAVLWDSLTAEESAYLEQRIARGEAIVLGGTPWLFKSAFELPDFGRIHQQELEKLLCLPVTVRQHPHWSLLMAELASGDIDLLSGFVVTLERERQVEISNPIAYGQLSLLTLRTDIQLSRLSELRGEKLYINRGSSAADKKYIRQVLQAEGINNELVEVEALYSNRHFIENGIILTLDIFQAAHAFGEIERLQVMSFELSFPVSIGIRPDHPVLRRIIDKALDSGLRSELELLLLRYRAKTRYRNLLNLISPSERQRLQQLNMRPVVDDDSSQYFFPLKIPTDDFSWFLRYLAHSLGFEVLTPQQVQSQDQPFYGSDLFRTGLQLKMTTDAKSTARLTEPLFDIELVLFSNENQSLRNIKQIGIVENWPVDSTNFIQQKIPAVKVSYFSNPEKMLNAFVDKKIQHILLPRQAFTIFGDQTQIQSSTFGQVQARIQVPEPWLPIKSSVNMVLTTLAPVHELINIWEKGLERRRNAWQANQRKRLVDKRMDNLLVWVTYGGISLLLLYLLWDKRRSVRLSRYDLLTGCQNRNALAELNDHKQLEHKQWHRAAISVNVMELQTINQTHGDLGGDNVLRSCAELLQQIFDERQVYRIGAGEFFIYLPASATDLDRHFTEHLHKLDALRQQTEVDNKQRPGYSFRLGAARADHLELPSADLRQLVHATNIALLEARKDRLQPWRQCDQAMIKRFNRPRDLAAQLNQAFAKGQILPYYQPKVSLRHNRLIGAEALARWQHPTEGMISPAEFVPLLESRYEIHRLDWHITEAAIRFTTQGLQQGKLADEFTMSFNLSPRTFVKSDVIKNLTMLLDKYKLEPRHLEIEITETCFSGDIPDLKNTLTQLKALGVGLALDDFTAGFSSVTMLTELDIDTVKLDRSLITPVEQGNKRAELVCTGLIRMLKTTGQHLIAEGVEKQEACSFLSQQGINVVQGFVFSKPLPDEQFLVYQPPLFKAKSS